MIQSYASRRVLIVEDHPDIRMLYSRLLMDAQIESACTGAQAIEMLGKGPYDLIILDMHLGRISGLDVLAEARSRDAYAETPVLVVSSDDSLQRQAKQLGISAWITKPLDIERLLNAVDLLLPS